MNKTEVKVLEAANLPDVPLKTRSGCHPKLFVIDLVFPGTDGPATVSAICREFPSASLIVVTMLEESPATDQMLKAGVDGLKGKSLTAAAIMEGINSARAGGYLVKLTAPEKGQMTEGFNLTPRQKDVLRLLSENMTNKMIARELGLSHFTVRNHVSNLMLSLRVQRRNQLGPRARALGLLTTDYKPFPG